MSRDSEYKPLSLTQHFDPNEDFTGCFGWICGYSADAGFLNNAVERFTGRTTAQRAYEGKVSVALMLDSGGEQITPIEVPGLLHLPVKMPADLPFKLLHAKVAILGFRHDSEPKRFQLKLIVSTGNWTRLTLEESLDLAWCAEIDSNDLLTAGDATIQSAVDISSAWEMIQWLSKHFDTRLLSPNSPGQTGKIIDESSKTLDKWLKRVKKLGRDGTPQFIDNRHSSFLDQLPKQIVRCGPPTARNYLAMGSGYYESTNVDGRVPSVLRRIADRLRQHGLLTRSADVEIYVNPHGCQAVSTSRGAIRKVGWSVHDAVQPSCFQSLSRSLHAKFIFGCTYRSNSNYCNSPWLYLGSGNLTHPGFANSIHPNHGNLEAGVVFSPQGLQWEEEIGASPECLLSNRLPVGTDAEHPEPGSLVVGGDMPHRELKFSAAPIACLFWAADVPDGWLISENQEESSFEVLDESGLPREFHPIKGFRVTGDRPRQVQIRWKNGSADQTAWIPIVDEYGRLAATVLPKIDIEHAWEQLENFPMPPDDEDLRESGQADGRNTAGNASLKQSGEVRYPIREMMQLIENIASKQVSIHRMDWSLWCRRLEQCLTQAAESKVVVKFAQLGLNPLSPLKHKPFRPRFAENESIAEGLLFEESLNRVELAWNVSELTDIGGQR